MRSRQIAGFHFSLVMRLVGQMAVAGNPLDDVLENVQFAMKGGQIYKIA